MSMYTATNTSLGFRLSRYWNRLAYSIMYLGRRMIWDYTKHNDYLLDDINVFSSTSRSILCNKDYSTDS